MYGIRAKNYLILFKYKSFVMKYPNLVVIFIVVCLGCSTAKDKDQAADDHKALEETSKGILSGFARGDVAAILSYHHPDVTKALAYNKFIRGKAELEQDLKNTLEHVSLAWKENNVESLLIHGETAVEMTRFTIEGTPKDGGKPFTFKGRAMVVYVRSKDSPSGWASIREVVQPSNE